MADATSKNTPVNPVPHEGDHDRVTMLSLHADGTHAQHNPEIVGDLDAAKAATREQFKQQAVSAVDVAERGTTTGVDEDAPQDPSIAALKEKHEKAAKASESAADKTVDSLSKS